MGCESKVFGVLCGSNFCSKCTEEQKTGIVLVLRSCLRPSTDKYPTTMGTCCLQTAAGAGRNRGRGEEGLTEVKIRHVLFLT